MDTNGDMIEIQSGARDVENRIEEDNISRDWYPFDPYMLPRSKGYVTDCFLEYMGSDPEEDEEMVTTDGEDFDESDDMDDDNI